MSLINHSTSLCSPDGPQPRRQGKPRCHQSPGPRPARAEAPAGDHGEQGHTCPTRPHARTALPQRCGGPGPRRGGSAGCRCPGPSRGSRWGRLALPGGRRAEACPAPGPRACMPGGRDGLLWSLLLPAATGPKAPPPASLQPHPRRGDRPPTNGLAPTAQRPSHRPTRAPSSPLCRPRGAAARRRHTATVSRPSRSTWCWRTTPAAGDAAQEPRTVRPISGKIETRSRRLARAARAGSDNHREHRLHAATWPSGV